MTCELFIVFIRSEISYSSLPVNVTREKFTRTDTFVLGKSVLIRNISVDFKH